MYKIGNYFYSVELASNGTNRNQFGLTATLDKIKYAIYIHQYDQEMKELKKRAFRGTQKDSGPFSPRIIFCSTDNFCFFTIAFWKIIIFSWLSVYFWTR